MTATQQIAAVLAETQSPEMAHIILKLYLEQGREAIVAAIIDYVAWNKAAQR